MASYSLNAYVDPTTGQARQVTPELNSLLSGGQYRDIPTSIIPDYLNGKLSHEQAVASITGTPTFDPAKGPQYDFGKGPSSALPDFTKVNSSLLAPVPSLAYKSPNPSPVPDVTKLDSNVADMQMTAPEGEASNLVKRLQDLNKSLVGESAFRTQQENALGIPELARTQKDLAARLTALKNEAASIPLKLEEQSVGRGITTTILGRQQEKLQRENAIQSLATSSLLEASRGNLTLAMDMVDRAVKAKFDPIREEIAANKTNLELIQSSPEYTLADKNRAAKQQLALDERKRSLDQAEKDQTSVYQIALEAAKNGADALTLKSIQEAKTPALALEAAAGVLQAHNYTFQTITSEDSFGNKSERIIALDPKTGKVVGDAGASGFTGGGTSGSTSTSGYSSQQQQQIDAYARQYAATGQIPTGLPKGLFGVVSDAAKAMPKQVGTIVDAATGTRSSGVSDTLQGGFSNLYSTIELANQLKQLDTQRIHGVVSGTLGKVFGSDAQARYVDLKTQISDLLARARTGAAINAQEEALYNGMLPGRFSNTLGFGVDSQTRIDNFIKNLSSDLDNKTRSQGLSIYGFSTVTVNGQKYTVGDTLKNADGQTGRVLPDGSVYVEEKAGSSHVSLDTLKKNIASTESSGDYNAVGLPTPSGRALGKYQILPSNLALVNLDGNNPAHRQKFLQSPALQDRAFNKLIAQLHTRYAGDPTKIAAAYYGGPKAAQIVGTPAADKPQQAGGKRMPSINEYVRKILRA
jgi:hypothetical protein